MYGTCFVMQYLVSFLVLQSSCRERESWLLYFVFLSCGCSEADPEEGSGVHLTPPPPPRTFFLISYDN